MFDKFVTIYLLEMCTPILHILLLRKCCDQSPYCIQFVLSFHNLEPPGIIYIYFVTFGGLSSDAGPKWQHIFFVF